MMSGKTAVTSKKQEAGMKKSESRMKRTVLIAGTVLCMGLSVFPAAAAGRIQKISIYLDGEQAKPGQFLDDTLSEITTSRENYTIHRYDYVNDRVKWDRRDTPELMVELYYDTKYKLSKRRLREDQMVYGWRSVVLRGRRRNAACVCRGLSLLTARGNAIIAI